MKTNARIVLCAALACGVATPVLSTQAPATVRPNLINTCNGGGDTDPWDDLKSGIPVAASVRLPATTSTKVAGLGAAAAVIGTTPDAVHAKFAAVIEANFANGATETLVARLSDKELAAIARHYQAVAGTQGTPLLKTLASRISDDGMVRVARAFDPQAVRAAVAAFAPASVQISFNSKMAAVQPNLLPGGGDGGGGGGGGSGGNPPGTGASPAPNVDMTLEEIYLEYRTAPVGSLSAAGALSETAMFAGARLTAAAGVGYTIGTQINGLIDEYDPELGDAIGGTIDATITNYHDAVNEVEQGHYQSAWDDMFGYPVSNSGNVGGDWDVSVPMEDYYGGGGSCGW